MTAQEAMTYLECCVKLVRISNPRDTDTVNLCIETLIKYTKELERENLSLKVQKAVSP